MNAIPELLTHLYSTKTDKTGEGIVGFIDIENNKLGLNGPKGSYECELAASDVSSIKAIKPGDRVTITSVGDGTYKIAVCEKATKSRGKSPKHRPAPSFD